MRWPCSEAASDPYGHKSLPGGQCVLELDELEAVALRDQLTEWLG